MQENEKSFSKTFNWSFLLALCIIRLQWPEKKKTMSDHWICEMTRKRNEWNDSISSSDRNTEKTVRKCTWEDFNTWNDMQSTHRQIRNCESILFQFVLCFPLPVCAKMINYIQVKLYFCLVYTSTLTWRKHMKTFIISYKLPNNIFISNYTGVFSVILKQIIKKMLREPNWKRHAVAWWVIEPLSHLVRNTVWDRNQHKRNH